MIAALLLLGLLVSLTSLANLARAAPGSAALGRESGRILPGAASAKIPLQQATEADLSITKTNGQDETIPGEQTIYTIIVTNLELTTAVTGATVTDIFPGILTGVTWTCSGPIGTTCTASGNDGIADMVNLPPLSSVTYMVTGTVSPSATGSLVNTASVAPPVDITDPIPDNDSSTDTDTLTPEADLSISKTSNASEVVPGTTVTYTIVASNSSGPSDISGAIVSDTFPAALTGVSWTCLGSNGGICSGGASGDINEIVDLPVGGLVTFIVTGTVDPDATGLLANMASITVPVGASDSDSSNNSDAETDTLTPQVDLSISKTNGEDTTIPGTSTTYTIMVSNTGPSSANGVTVTDIFSTGLTVGSWSCLPSGGAICSGGSGNISTTVNLPPGTLVTFTVPATVNPDARGTLVNTAMLAPPAEVIDLTPGNNNATDTDTLTPKTDLQISKSDSPDPVSAGNTLTYNIAIFNDGDSNATGVTLFDNLPDAGVTLISAIPSQGSCGGTNDVTCNLGTIAKDSNATVSIQVKVNSSWSDTLSNSANVSGNEFDPNPLNNFTPPVNTAVQVKPDLTITKLESADPTPLGVPLIYTLRITNNGPSDAPGVVVTDTLPGGISFVSATPSQGNPCSGTSTIVCNLLGMTSGATATVTIVVNPQSTGTLNNSASVSVTGGGASDPNGGNNSSSTSTTINRVTDLAITKTDSPDPITAGNNLTYNLNVTNIGPSPALTVTVTDTLPGGVTFQSVTPSRGTCSGATTITCNLGGMAKGSSAIIAIIVKVNEATAGNISNTASVGVSGSSDLNSGNNSANATTFVGILFKNYLPLILTPPPTELFIDNDTGGPVTFTVVEAGVSCNVPAGEQNYPCGDPFPPGTYTIQVNSICGTLTSSKTYGSGPQTTRVFCTN